MSEEQRRLLQQQLWRIADTLRGKMNADEFRDYILGFIFYKYLSEKIALFANQILKADNLQFAQIDELTEDGALIIEHVREATVKELGYFLKPSELFHTLAQKGNSRLEAADGTAEQAYIIADLERILRNIEQSTLGTDSQDDFINLFEDLDLTSSKLGNTEKAKNELVSKILLHLDKIDFQLEQADGDAKADVLGDAYEYLIGEFASGAGKRPISKSARSSACAATARAASRIRRSRRWARKTCRPCRSPPRRRPTRPRPRARSSYCAWWRTATRWTKWPRPWACRATRCAPSCGACMSSSR